MRYETFEFHHPQLRVRADFGFIRFLRAFYIYLRLLRIALGMSENEEEQQAESDSDCRHIILLFVRQTPLRSLQLLF
jgi:hypothetical protein